MPQNVTSELIRLRQTANKLRQLERLSTEFGICHTSEQREYIRVVRSDIRQNAATRVSEKMRDLLRDANLSHRTREDIDTEILNAVAVMGRHIAHIH